MTRTAVDNPKLATLIPRRAPFTHQFLMALQPPAIGRYEVFDEGTKAERLPGFGIRVSHTGKRVFFVLYRKGGTLRRYTFDKPFPEITLDAREHVKKIRGNEDYDAALEKSQRRKEPSFRELAELVRVEYFESDKVKKPLSPRPGTNTVAR